MIEVTRYKLKKDIPGIKAGTIFKHIDYNRNSEYRDDPPKPAYATADGHLITGDYNDFGKHDFWCKENTCVLPIAALKDTEWFEEQTHDEYMREFKESIRDEERRLGVDPTHKRFYNSAGEHFDPDPDGMNDM